VSEPFAPLVQREKENVKGLSGTRSIKEAMNGNLDVTKVEGLSGRDSKGTKGRRTTGKDKKTERSD